MGSPQTCLFLLAFDKRWALQSTSPPTLLIIPSLLSFTHPSSGVLYLGWIKVLFRRMR